jgi:topoisomerase-4 subunit A
MDLIKAKLAQVRKHLASLTEYAISFLEDIAKRLEKDWPRRTELESFHQVAAKEAARRDLALRYDSGTGYLGTSLSSGDILAHVSPYDKVIAIRRNGVYTAMTVPEKLFVDSGLLFCGSAEKEELSKNLFTIVFKDGETGFPYIKRCRIEQYINNRDYLIIPDGSQMLLFSAQEDFEFTVTYEPKPRMKVKEEAFRASDFEERGLKTLGVRLAAKEAASAQIGVTKLAAKAARAADAAARAEELFPEAPARAGKAPKNKAPAAKRGRPSKSGAASKAGSPKAKAPKASPKAASKKPAAPPSPSADEAPRGLRERAEAARRAAEAAAKASPNAAPKKRGRPAKSAPAKGKKKP